MFNPEGELEANQAEMTEATNHVKTGSSDLCRS